MRGRLRGGRGRCDATAKRTRTGSCGDVCEFTFTAGRSRATLTLRRRRGLRRVRGVGRLRARCERRRCRGRFPAARVPVGVHCSLPRPPTLPRGSTIAFTGTGRHHSSLLLVQYNGRVSTQACGTERFAQHRNRKRARNRACMSTPCRRRRARTMSTRTANYTPYHVGRSRQVLMYAYVRYGRYRFAQVSSYKYAKTGALRVPTNGTSISE